MATYTDPEPASGAELISVSQPLITGNFAYLHLWMQNNTQTTNNPDHIYTGNSAGAHDGSHNVIHFVNQAGDPPVVSGAGMTYTKGAPAELFYESSNGKVSQLTVSNTGGSFAANTNYIAPVTTLGGWSFLGGGLIMQYGFIVPTSTPGITVVDYPIRFPSGNAAFSIQVTAYVPGNTNDLSASVAVQGTATQFTAGTLSGGGVKGFYWMAIGN